MNKKPNVVIFMTDDHGYGDLSCMGATDFKTPNIDALAEAGIRFTSMYSGSPVCSPSRASLLTGRYPGNAGVRAILAGHRKASGLTPEVPTIATALKELGYATGISGKWHLGLKDECRPNSNGFDEFNGFLAGCLDYYSHIFYYGMTDGGCNPTHDLWENENEVWDNGEYLTERITSKSIDFINGQLVEFEKPVADVFLSDLETDPGESHNLAYEMPELCEQMKQKAIEWREGIEKTWDEKFAKNYSLA